MMIIKIMIIITINPKKAYIQHIETFVEFDRRQRRTTPALSSGPTTSDQKPDFCQKKI